MHPLMSRSRMDERFWYNCKQGLDCSQGDIQVISRRWVINSLEISLMFSLYFRSRKKVEKDIHQGWKSKEEVELGKMYSQSCFGSHRRYPVLVEDLDKYNF